MISHHIDNGEELINVVNQMIPNSDSIVYQPAEVITKQQLDSKLAQLQNDLLFSNFITNHLVATLLESRDPKLFDLLFEHINMISPI
jgi:hypothetical protein